MKNKIIIAFVIILLAIGGILVFTQKNNSNNNGLPFIVANPSAPGVEFKFTDEETKQYNDALVEALKYKSEGDQGKPESYQKAIEFYAKAAEIGKGKVWVPYLNLGNVYVSMKNYVLAEAAYNEALKIAPEGLIYQAKIDLYRYNLDKSVDDVVALYKEANAKVVDNADVYASYGAYLEANNRNSEALTVFEDLAKRFPDNQNYKQEVTTLKTKVK